MRHLLGVLLLGIATFNSLPIENAAAAEPKKKLLVCSTTQVADFARQVAGDRWQVKSILAAGQDPHLYNPTPADAKLVASADLCAENGWHLEGHDWMATLAKDARKPIITCINDIEPFQVKTDGESVRDPHGWFTPKNAAVYTRNLLDGIVKADPEHAEEYEARADLYLQELRTLHLWIVKQVNAIPASKRVLVTSHDAFNYFCREYGFTAASPAGWSTGAEVGGGITPERRKQTVESIKGFGVKAIFVETSVNPDLVRELAREAGVAIGGELYSDAMGPIGTAGETYLGMMRENVLTIVHALK